MNDLLAHLKSLIRDDRFFGEDDLGDDFKTVEDEEWTQDGKYQSHVAVYRHNPTGRHFQIQNMRSGSYHTDWYYSTPYVTEVVPVEKVVTTITWEAVK